VGAEAEARRVAPVPWARGRRRSGCEGRRERRRWFGSGEREGVGEDADVGRKERNRGCGRARYEGAEERTKVAVSDPTQLAFFR